MLELKTFNTWYNEQTTGTYAGFKLTEESNKKILDLCKTLNLENPVQEDDIHCTLLYSRKMLPDYKPDNSLYPQNIKAKDFKLFGDTLVLCIEGTFCKDRHKQLMNEHKGTYDFPEYIPHITLGFEVDKLPKPLDKEINLIIQNEYKEDLNLDWNDRNKDE